MAYYLMVDTKKGKYEPIEIKKSKYFNVQKKQYVKDFAYALSEIDEFTMQFENETDLRIALLDDCLLTDENKNRALSIRFLSKNQYDKVRHDFLYKKDLNYIKHPNFVIDFVMKKFYEEDYLFIQKLAANFSRYHECANTATDVMYGAAHSLYNGRKDPMLEIFDLNGDLLVTRLIKLIIYKYTTDYSGYTRYKNEVNYRNLHTLVAFINNYYKDKILTEESKSKVKAKTKEVVGQISLFD